MPGTSENSLDTILTAEINQVVLENIVNYKAVLCEQFLQKLSRKFSQTLSPEEWDDKLQKTRERIVVAVEQYLLVSISFEEAKRRIYELAPESKQKDVSWYEPLARVYLLQGEDADINTRDLNIIINSRLDRALKAQDMMRVELKELGIEEFDLLELDLYADRLHRLNEESTPSNQAKNYSRFFQALSLPVPIGLNGFKLE